MADPVPPQLQHVVYCVRLGNHDAAAAFWRDLGVSLEEPELAGKGVRVSINMAAGVEIVSPGAEHGTETDRYQQFLDERGEGIWSVVLRVANVEDRVPVAERYGSSLRHEYRQEAGEVAYHEVDMSPVVGMPVTFLATNLF